MTVEEAENLLANAMLGSDVATLHRLLSDELSYIAHTGSKLSKTQDIEAHEAGRLKFYELERSNQHIKELGDVAVVQANVKMRFTYDGEELFGKFMFTRVWHRLDQGWQVIVAHSCAHTG